MYMLPQDCLSLILSFTSPIDVCRFSSVSSAFRLAADSDAVWERFLPSNYVDILSRVDSAPLTFSSKKELFLLMCNPLLIDGGSKSFKIEKSSGKVIYTISARELSITLSDVPTYWRWIPANESRFSEVAVLITTWWLEIRGTIWTRMLSPNTTYGAYLKMKICNRAYGFDSVPTQTSVEVGNQVSSTSTYLDCKNSKKQSIQQSDKDKNEKMLSKTNDEWEEIELGEFFTSEVDEELKMILMESNYQLKGGLVVEAIEVRPKLQS